MTDVYINVGMILSGFIGFTIGMLAALFFFKCQK